MGKENNFFTKLKNSLVKTKNNFSGKIDQLINYSGVYDDDFFEELEEILILADLGVETTSTIIDKTREKIKVENITDKIKVKNSIKEIIRHMLIEDGEDQIAYEYPMVILVVGVNGVGKTTTIAKLAHRFKKDGKKVLLAAGDTFRAGAVEQLNIWSQRIGVDLIKNDQGADPAAVIFDALQAGKARGVDVLICDTAGRLHNKDNLMKELSKINKVIENEADHYTQYNLLALDATSGTNAVSQANIFNQATKLDGIVLTKLDGTSKGGIIITIKTHLKIPIRYIGVGEQIDDLQEFDATNFVEALF